MAVNTLAGSNMQHKGSSLALAVGAASESGVPRCPHHVTVPDWVKIRRFGETSGPTAAEFIRQVKAAWRAERMCPADQIDMVLEHVTDKVRQELKLHQADDAQAMLDVIEREYGERRSIVELAAVFFSLRYGDNANIRNFSYQLYQAFEAIVNAQKRSNMVAWDTSILRDQFIELLQDRTCRQLAKERVYQDPSTTFLSIRNFAVRWAGEEEISSCNVFLAGEPVMNSVNLVERSRNERCEVGELNAEVTTEGAPQALPRKSKHFAFIL